MKKKKAIKRASKYRDFNYSELGAHKREGTRFRPPLAQMDKMRTSSWQDDHLPPMLWAALLCSVFPRKVYLACFKEILETCSKWFSEGGIAFEAPPEGANPDDGLFFSAILDHEALAKLPDNEFETFIRIPLRYSLGHAALRPITLFDSIPNVERWRSVMGVKPEESDWEAAGRAVGSTLDHQSEASTDIRWFKVMLGILAGRMNFDRSFEERVREFFEYPNRGDMRSVRPSIRSMEMLMRRKAGAKWIEAFWQTCSDRTACVAVATPDDGERTETALMRGNVLDCRLQTITRFMSVRTSVRTDSRLDSSFGLVFYALSIIDEIGHGGSHEGVLGRLGLRALVEAYITLRYLCSRDTEQLWSSWRVFGAGQAKLAFLKAQEDAGDLPEFIDEQALHEIANEDKWQEFVDIDVGHWARANLRSLADQCGAKNIYDKYYSWSSTFVHSHWGAVRDTNFITCQNPLHRLHRIPRIVHRRLSSMEADAIALFNEMLTLLESLYPGESPLTPVELSRAQEAE